MIFFPGRESTYLEGNVPEPHKQIERLALDLGARLGHKLAPVSTIFRRRRFGFSPYIAGAVSLTLGTIALEPIAEAPTTCRAASRPSLTFLAPLEPVRIRISGGDLCRSDRPRIKAAFLSYLPRCDELARTPTHRSLRF